MCCSGNCESACKKSSTSVARHCAPRLSCSPRLALGQISVRKNRRAMRAEPSVEPPSATMTGRVPAAWQRRSSALWSISASLKTGTTIPMEGSRGWLACVPRRRVRFCHSTRRRAQAADIVDQMPDLLVVMNLAEARHAAQANAVLDDPEKLRVGPLLYFRRVQSKRAWIHPPANFGRRAAVNAVTVRALATIGHLTDRHAPRVIRWRLRQRPPGAPRDDPELGLGGQVSLHSPGLVERAQAEVIQDKRSPGGEEQQRQKEKEQNSAQHQSPPGSHQSASPSLGPANFHETRRATVGARGAVR